MGTSLLCHCLYGHHSFIAIVMGLNRYILPMLMIILCCNIFPTKEEETKKQEDEREENWNLENIQEKVMDRRRNIHCTIFTSLNFYYCQAYKRYPSKHGDSLCDR